MLEVEQVKPWTAIIPLNEEYYIATKEQLTGNTLPLIRLKSRKSQQEGDPQPIKPLDDWENYTCKEVLSLLIDFDIREPKHENFNLQKQVSKDRKRGLKAVFIDFLTLKVPYEDEIGSSERIWYEIDFGLRRTPKFSETRKTIRQDVRNMQRKYNLYSDISKRDKKFYNRIFQSPSCLEIIEIRKFALPFQKTKKGDNCREFLSGTTFESQKFLSKLSYKTHGIVWDAYKKYDFKSGYVLDGLVPPSLMESIMS